MLLALETSDRLCAACLYDMAGREVVVSKTLDIGRGHAELLMGVIEDVMQGRHYHQLSGIAVGVGPGSFTGIRVGVSAAIGFSVALKIPKIGITSFQSLALAVGEQSDSNDILVLVDANRGDVYAQRFDASGNALNEPAQMSLDTLVASNTLINARLCGSGVAALQALSPLTNLNLAPEIIYPNVDIMARAATDEKYHVPVKPLYLRRPDAKPQASYIIARAAR